MQARRFVFGMCVAHLGAGCTLYEGASSNIGFGAESVAAIHAAEYTRPSTLATPLRTVAFAEPPPLAYIDPDVYIVEDADQALYYVEGAYWRKDGPAWSRANYWDSAWVIVLTQTVPNVIILRHHEEFRHYHGYAGVAWREPREHASSDEDRVHPGTQRVASLSDLPNGSGPWRHVDVTALAVPGATLPGSSRADGASRSPPTPP